MATTYGGGCCSLVFSLAMDTHEEVEHLSGDEASDLGPIESLAFSSGGGQEARYR